MGVADWGVFTDAQTSLAALEAALVRPAQLALGCRDLKWGAHPGFGIRPAVCGCGVPGGDAESSGSPKRSLVLPVSIRDEPCKHSPQPTLTGSRVSFNEFF